MTNFQTYVQRSGTRANWVNGLIDYEPIVKKEAKRLKIDFADYEVYQKFFKLERPRGTLTVRKINELIRMARVRGGTVSLDGDGQRLRFKVNPGDESNPFWKLYLLERQLREGARAAKKFKRRSNN